MLTGHSFRLKTATDVHARRLSHSPTLPLEQGDNGAGRLVTLSPRQENRENVVQQLAAYEQAVHSIADALKTGITLMLTMVSRKNGVLNQNCSKPREKVELEKS